MNFSFCIRKLAVAFYMINEIQPKIKFQNIVQCPFKCLFALFDWYLHASGRLFPFAVITFFPSCFYFHEWINYRENFLLQCLNSALKDHNWVNFAHRL